MRWIQALRDYLLIQPQVKDLLGHFQTLDFVSPWAVTLKNSEDRLFIILLHTSKLWEIEAANTSQETTLS